MPKKDTSTANSSFHFHPNSPVLFANVLPICSLWEVKKEDLGVQPPALVSFPGVCWQRISPGWVGRAATEGADWLHCGLSSQSLWEVLLLLLFLGGTSMWLVTALISSVGFAVAALTLPFLTWKTSKMFQYLCCPIAVLPDTLVTFLTVFSWFLGCWVFTRA